MTDDEGILNLILSELRSINSKMEAMPSNISAAVAKAMSEQAAEDPDFLTKKLLEEAVSTITDIGGYEDLVRGMEDLEDYVRENEKDIYDECRNYWRVDWVGLLIGDGLIGPIKHNRIKLITYACRFHKKLVKQVIDNVLEKEKVRIEKMKSAP